jgi:hypothetical protein
MVYDIAMRLRKYIFYTEEGTTYQPGSESVTPDIENLQVVGFGQGESPEAAVRNMVAENKYILETAFDEVIGVELRSERRTFHYLGELRGK